MASRGGNDYLVRDSSQSVVVKAHISILKADEEKWIVGRLLQASTDRRINDV